MILSFGPLKVQYENLLLSETRSTDTVVEQALSGRIAQELIYDYPGNWLRIADDQNYRHADACIKGLEKLLRDPRWDGIAASIGSLIDLGVGTGSKLAHFTSDIFLRRPNLSVLMIDRSDELLVSASEALAAVKEALGRDFAAYAARSDFYDLRETLGRKAAEDIRAFGNGCSALLLLGNTIGNVEEVRMLTAMRDVTQRGDLLIISLEFASTPDGAQSEREMCQSYRAPAINDLYIAPFKRLPGFRDRLMRIRAVRGDPAYSSLEKTITIESSASWNGAKVFGTFSNKYDQMEFMEFVRRFDFELLFEVTSPLSPFFKYLVFKRG